MLLLDDYHLIDAPPIHHALAFLLDHAPPQLHLVIASRADPPLPVSRLRARGELTELRAADLRFTPEEAAAFLTEVMHAAVVGAGGGRARNAHRGLDRRLAVRRARPARSHRLGRLHRCVYRQQPLRGRLPGRGGASATAPRAARRFLLHIVHSGPPVCAPLRCSAARRNRRGAIQGEVRRCLRSWSGPICSSCRWMIGATGIAITTCLSTSCARACAAARHRSVEARPAPPRQRVV